VILVIEERAFVQLISIKQERYISVAFIEGKTKN